MSIFKKKTGRTQETDPRATAFHYLSEEADIYGRLPEKLLVPPVALRAARLAVVEARVMEIKRRGPALADEASLRQVDRDLGRTIRSNWPWRRGDREPVGYVVEGFDANNLINAIKIAASWEKVPLEIGGPAMVSQVEFDGVGPMSQPLVDPLESLGPEG